MYKLTVLLALMILIGCKELGTSAKADLCFSDPFYQEITQVSINDISTIKSLEGKFVQMQGVLRFSFEDVALYSSSSSGSAKAFWLEFKIPNDSTMAQIKALSNKKVKIVGRVNLHDNGHLGAYCGTLDSVFCVK